MALWLATLGNLPLWRALGGTDESPVPVYASGLNPGRAAYDTVGRMRAAGYRAYKIKVGFGEETDLGSLRPVAKELKAGERWMVDVNQGWDLRTASALAFLLALSAQAAIPIEHWTHASGARVYLVASPSIPMLDVQLDFDGGSRRDPATQAGLANATAGLLSGGVAAQPGLPALDENQLSEAWVDLGAQFGAQASADRFTLSLRTLTESDLLRPAHPVVDAQTPGVAVVEEQTGTDAQSIDQQVQIGVSVHVHQGRAGGELSLA